MIKIEKIDQYADEILNDIADINYKMIVIDDSQLVKKMSDITDDKNLILVGYIPSHIIEGNSEDNAQTKDFTAWLVLNKIDRSDGHDEFIASMIRCQNATNALMKKMMADKSPIDNACSLMRMLQVQSIKANPIWALAGCDGYEIIYELKSNPFN